MKSSSKEKLITKLTRHGLGFLCNVIENGCSKPVTKLRMLDYLINTKHNVRQHPTDTCSVIIDGFEFSLVELDDGITHILNKINPPCGGVL